jgi:hypothetical protein
LVLGFDTFCNNGDHKAVAQLDDRVDDRLVRVSVQTPSMNDLSILIVSSDSDCYSSVRNGPFQIVKREHALSTKLMQKRD